MSVIVVRLQSGLGNQMFQYALGRKMALLHNASLKLDLSLLEHDPLRVYSLHVLNIQENFVNAKEQIEMKLLTLARWNPVLRGIKPLIKQVSGWQVFVENELMPFNAAILAHANKICLEGYWQSEKYFKDIQEIIQREFTCRHQLSVESQKIAEEIAKHQSISIHIRRGDYCSPQTNKQIHYPCSPTYYERCVEAIAHMVPNPHFFVFSDSAQWVKENFSLDYPMTIVSDNHSAKDYEDLWLMSQCRHNIIANSTFSWWAAWLNPNPEKKIFAPQKWFNDHKLDTRDLLPADWIKL